jgi:hypothetical protein
MSKRSILSSVGRFILGAGAVISMASCGGDLLRTGRAPVFLVIDSMSATAGGGGSATSAFLLSDVQTLVEQTVNGVTVMVPTIFNDSATAVIRALEKNPSATETQLNNVTLTRYRVNFFRTDGRNTPGVDVPYGFDGGLGITVSVNSTASVAFEIVRHQAKLEPPLANLTAGGGQLFISTIAEITFYGRDQNGNEVTVAGRIDVQFGDFGDE